MITTKVYFDLGLVDGDTLREIMNIIDLVDVDYEQRKCYDEYYITRHCGSYNLNISDLYCLSDCVTVQINPTESITLKEK